MGPQVRGMSDEITDYNGTGDWSAERIVARHAAWARRLRVESPYPLEIERGVHRHEGKVWIYPVMEQVLDGIAAGDGACACIGIEFIEQDQGFPFGRILKEKAARRLARFDGLSAEQRERIRERVVSMLETGKVPREFRAYARLLRRVGVGEHRPRIAAAVPRNDFTAGLQAYILEHCAPG